MLNNWLRCFLVGLLACFSLYADAKEELPPFEVDWPEVIAADAQYTLKVHVNQHIPIAAGDSVARVEFYVGSEPTLVPLDPATDVGHIKHTFSTDDTEITISALDHSDTHPVTPIPLWWSILPPLLAITMALAFREVLSALFLGIFAGAAVIGVYAEGPIGLLTGIFMVIDTYVLGALEDGGHLSVIVFSMTIGGIVAVISKNGGMRGVVDHVAKFAKTPQSGQFGTWLLGVLIFFDDYANTLVVGNTMRAVTDKLRISREKLAYLVDSTAAPIAAIAFVTTWIGFELGQIGEALKKINEDTVQIAQGEYSIFLGSLQYSFYPVFTLVFMLMLIWRNSDFGPMFAAEQRARLTGKVSLGLTSKGKEQTEELEDELDEFEPKKGAPSRAINAVIPIAVIILGTLVGLWYTGMDNLGDAASKKSGFDLISSVIGEADSYASLLWSSISGLLVAILMSVSQRILSLYESVGAAMTGFKTMLPAILILVLAWALASVTEHLHTANFLSGLLEGNLAPWLVPALTFIVAGLVAFSTGSSWSTMAILYPIMLPTGWQVCVAAGYDPQEAIMILLNTTSAVLAGSVLGDHCSPISDTTILSSLASSCNHIDHVRTQMPYALTVGGVSIAVGTIPGALGMPWWLTFPLGIAALYAIIRLFGKRVPDVPKTVQEA